MPEPMNYKQAHDIVCAVADFGINSEEVVLGLGAGPNVIIQALCTTALSSTPKPPIRVVDLPTSLPPTAKPSHEEIGPEGGPSAPPAAPVATLSKSIHTDRPFPPVAKPPTDPIGPTDPGLTPSKPDPTLGTTPSVEPKP